MSIVYVGLDLGSSSFHQVAISSDGSASVNRSFSTSELNLRKAFADLHGELHVHLEAGELAPWAAAKLLRSQCADVETTASSALINARSKPHTMPLMHG